MSGPIIRSGPSPKFTANWDSIFGKGGAKKGAGSKSAKKSAAKAEKKTAAPKSTKKKAAKKGKK